jgi:two-component system, LuxR family, response regulator FixJ
MNTMIALVEDDEAVLRSLGMLLAKRGHSVKSYKSAEEFLEAVARNTPLCVVSDIRMPGMSGLELHRTLKRSHPALPVILITGHGDIAMAVEAIKQGAFDFVEKPFDDDQLMARIQAALESGQRMRVEQEEKTNLAERMTELSPRQVEVMELVVDGLSNKEIALKLQISPRTVENYRAWVMEKMGANNLADLVRKVMVLKS